MPVHATCRLRIGGRLAGPPEANAAIIQRLYALLPEERPALIGGGWPGGLESQGWQVSLWDAAAEVGGELDQETRFAFHLELSRRLDGTVYDCRDELTYTLFHGFAHYREAVWHKDLKVRLEELNHGIAHDYGPAKLLERLWFRQWEFFCGNGGDS
jgi:hypothetical protein